MSNLNQSVRILGAGAAILGTLAGCSNRAAPAAPQAPATIQTEATKPASTAAPTTDAPAATTAPTEPSAANVAPTTAVAEATATEVAPTDVPTEAPAAQSTGQYKDGEYTTESVRVDRWGQLQLKVTIEGGQLTKIDVLEYPHSTRRSDIISRAALPTLITEAIQKQDANVDMVTRATDTCVAFVESLEPLLNSAKTSNT